MFQDLICIADHSRKDIEKIFAVAAEQKERLKRGISYLPLMGKALALVFEKPSLRTRVTFEAGMTQLGGHAIYLGPSDINLGVRESPEDVARNLERWTAGIVVRTFAHDTVVRIADASNVPVINGLTDRCHPCQVLSDCFTILERFGTLQGVKVAYVGDGNNVANSWVNAAGLLDFKLSLACPEGYTPDTKFFNSAKKKAGDRLQLTHSVEEAMAGADVIYTDVWTSMGQEAEAEVRRQVFAPYQVNARVVKMAKPEVLVMHCLPVHRGEEVTADVIDGPHSIVYNQAENRLHVQKAIMILLMAPRNNQRTSQHAAADDASK